MCKDYNRLRISKRPRALSTFDFTYLTSDVFLVYLLEDFFSSIYLVIWMWDLFKKTTIIMFYLKVPYCKKLDFMSFIII